MDEGKAEVRKKCFIITPIGDNGSEIRRHIDGIIDAALIPVLEEKFDYELEVAHRIDAPGNIPKQVITSIYDSDLVVANLTGNNPNVMYELALRHCFGTAVIIIAEIETKIPADIVSERTIFYVNDARGILDLKDKLESMVQRIHDDGKVEQSGPVYDALREERDKNDAIVKIPDSANADAFTMILDKLDILQKDIRRKEYRVNEENHERESLNAVEYVMRVTCNADDLRILESVIFSVLDQMNVEYRWRRVEEDSVEFIMQNLKPEQFHMIKTRIRNKSEKDEVCGLRIRSKMREAIRI